MLIHPASLFKATENARREILRVFALLLYQHRANLPPKAGDGKPEDAPKSPLKRFNCATPGKTRPARSGEEYW